MSRYLDTTGKATLGVGICARCGIKMSLTELMSDPNAPGLMVCKDDLDQLDPWRLPARPTEDITLRFPRPDLALTPGPSAVQVYDEITPVLGDNNGNAIAVAPNTNLQLAATAATLGVCSTWIPSGTYTVGAQVTPVTTQNQTTAALDIYMFTCIVAGTSGLTAPAWTNSPGTMVVDGQVLWINAGIYLS